MEPSEHLWDPYAHKLKAPREPKLNINLTGSSAGQGSVPASRVSVLNAEAPEFVPAFVQQATEQFKNVRISAEEEPQYPRYSAQKRLDKVKACPAAEAYQPPNGYVLPSGNYSARHSEPPNGYYDNLDLMRLTQIISSLIKYPGQFDDLLMVFMETCFPYFNDKTAMSQIAGLLVSHAINHANFRYNGVRLCWCIEQQSPEFREQLHLKCHKEIQENSNQQNVVLFIAELFTQLPHDSLYGSLLLDSLTKLLSMGGNENVKCVCQALKLTGYSLEQNHKESLDSLFSKLKTFKTSLSGSALIVLSSVIDLRDSNWGRGTEENVSSDSDYDQDCEELVNGILYETEGHELTNEEQDFLAANATNEEFLLDEDDPDGLCDPEPEMDEEIQAAFEEFVKFSKG